MTVPSGQVQIAIPAKDLEREDIDPLGPAQMNLGCARVLCLQQEEAVVFHFGEIPKKARGLSQHLHGLVKEVAHEIDHVNALLEQYSSARQVLISAPMFLVARTPPVTVAATQAIERAERIRIDQLFGFANVGHMAIVKACLKN
jgi:hypothetical protein